MSVGSVGKHGSDGGRDGKGTRWMWMMRRRNEVGQGGKGTETDAGMEGRDGGRGVMHPDVDRGEHLGCGTEHNAEGDESERKERMKDK